MHNLRSSKLNQILIVEKATGDHVGIGYTGESTSMKTAFVHASHLKKQDLS